MGYHDDAGYCSCMRTGPFGELHISIQSWWAACTQQLTHGMSTKAISAPFVWLPEPRAASLRGGLKEDRSTA